MKKRTEIMYYVLMAACIIYIAVMIWERVQVDQYPGLIHDTTTKSECEREPIN